jgi:hypothetical protein
VQKKLKDIVHKLNKRYRGARCLNDPPKQDKPWAMPPNLVSYKIPRRPYVVKGPLPGPCPSLRKLRAVGKVREAPKIAEKGRKLSAIGRYLAKQNSRRSVELDVMLHVRALADRESVTPELAIELVGGVEEGSRAPQTRLPVRVLRCALCYPLGSGWALVTIHPYEYRSEWCRRRRIPARWHKGMSVGYLLWCIAQAYREIYERHDEYAIWGHDLDDLVFERVKVLDHAVAVSIGS